MLKIGLYIDTLFDNAMRHTQLTKRSMIDRNYTLIYRELAVIYIFSSQFLY